MKRLRLAWRFRVLPWNVPANVVKYIGLRGPSEADIARGEELAEKQGWS
jgi:hypothetical protein